MTKTQAAAIIFTWISGFFFRGALAETARPYDVILASVLAGIAVLLLTAGER